MTIRPIRLLAALLALAVVAVACGGGNEVGEGVTVRRDGDGGAAAIVDPARTTTTLPPELADQVAVTTTAPAQQQQQQHQQQSTTTTAPQNLVLIQDESKGHAFEPLIIQVPAGGKVTWRNVRESAAAQIVGEDNAFVSPPLQPGQEWTFQFNSPGTFQYNDYNRPYTRGEIRVY